MFILKCVIVGPGAVGKTACCTMYVDRKHKPSYHMTIGADFKSKETIVDGKEVKIQLWDLAGQDRFGAVRQMYYRGLNALILMVDLTRPDSLKSAKAYLDDEIVPSTQNQPLKCAVVVGNKTDLEDLIAVSDQDLESLGSLVCDKLGIPTLTMKTTVMSLDSIDEMFTALLKCIVK